MTQLDIRNQQLVDWYCNQHLTLEECGARVGITRERVRQILNTHAPKDYKDQHHIYMLAQRKAQFWDRVNITADPDECWEWTMSRYPSGYGHHGLRVLDRSTYAHILAFALANNGIRARNWVLHHCDNPPCCNPNHLYDGTPMDNAQDRERRGRGGSGKRKVF